MELTVGLFSGLFIILAYVSGMDNPWYGSSLCFAFGLYYYRYEKKKCQVEHWGALKYYGLLFVALFMTGIAIMLFFILGNDSIIGNPVARNIASVSFGTAVIMLLYKVRIGNGVSSLLGKCSYEIFLVHPYMISILLKEAVIPKELLGILVIVLSIILAYLIHSFEEKVFGLLWSFRGNRNGD